MAERSDISRRDFIRRSAVGAGALALGSTAARGQNVSPNERVNIGWIGIGGRCKGLMQDVVDHVPEARTVAVCDLIEERIGWGKDIAQRDKPNGYTDFREMLDKEKLDGVMVITEPSAHAEVVVPVLEAGYNTFAEKPMDITVEAIDAITIAARKAKGFYQIGTQRRYHPDYIACMKAIHDGILGKITFMQGGWHWSTDPSLRKTDKDGGRLIEQSSHHMDVMSWVMKNQAPVNCVAMAYQQNPRPGGANAYTETHSATVFQFPDGQLFSYTHLFLLPGKYDKEILTVFGEKGAVDLNQAMYFGRDEKEIKLGEPSGKDWGRGTTEELQAFIRQIKTGEKPLANVETGRICSLMCIMGRMAMVNKEKNAFEPRVIRWKDLGTKTDLPPQAG